jgi:hypothetical protein
VVRHRFEEVEKVFAEGNFGCTGTFLNNEEQLRKNATIKPLAGIKLAALCSSFC